MLSIAAVSVHRNIRPKTPAPTSSTANIIVDTNLSWKAEVSQSPKRRRSRQGPCSARKKLIQNLNNAEVTLTPIRKATSAVEAVSSNDDDHMHTDIREKAIVENEKNIDGEIGRDGLLLVVQVHDNGQLKEENEEVEGGEAKSKNCSLIPLVNSKEISIRPIVRKVAQTKAENVEANALKSELSITNANCEGTSLQISGNISDIMKMQASKPAASKSPLSTKCTKIDAGNSIRSNNGVENAQISTKSFYPKTPTATKQLSVSKKFQNPSKKGSRSAFSTNLNRAVETLKNSPKNPISTASASLSSLTKSKTINDVLSLTPKVKVVTNPIVSNLQKICSTHDDVDAFDISDEMLRPWHMNNTEESTPTVLDTIKQQDGLETTDHMLPMAEIDLQEPYHMTGFPNPPGENRCWLNATLQALFAMPLLDTFHHYNLQDCSKLTKYLITTKVHWMKGSSGRDKAYQTVKLLKEELGVLDEAYPSERQQDVSEFLMILLNHIKSDLGKLISAEDDADEMENVPKNQQDSHKVVKTPQTPNKRQPLADISTPKNNSLKRCHSLGDQNQSSRVRKQMLTHSVQDLLSPKLRKLSNPSDPTYKVHTPPLAPTNDEIISYRNPVDENFQLYLMEHYTCKGCQKHRQKKVDNLMLFVDIPSDDSLAPIDLQKAVQNIFAPEERSLTCGNCKHDVHTMRTTFRRQPNILTLQVNRYGMSSEGIFAKISSDVKIPRNLDLSEMFLYDASRGSCKYEPICIIAHAGCTMDCGHYTSYVRHGEQWYHYNDMNVVPMTEEEALSAAQMTAYLVFFVKSTSVEQDSDQI